MKFCMVTPVRLKLLCARLSQPELFVFGLDPVTKWRGLGPSYRFVSSFYQMPPLMMAYLPAMD